jgi:radical SAM superfamily enzyme
MQVVELFTLGKFLRRQFGQPVQKLSIDGGFLKETGFLR